MLILQRGHQERIALYSRATGRKLGEVVCLEGSAMRVGLEFGDDVYIIRNEKLGGPSNRPAPDLLSQSGEAA